jgi:hypothetical protein
MVERSEIREARNFLKYSPERWAMPLIFAMESQKEHSAIQWVISCLRWASTNLFDSQYIDMINRLQAIANDETFVDIKEIQNYMNSLWYHNLNKNDLAIAIANCFAAEGSYRVGSVKHYKKELAINMGFFLTDSLDKIQVDKFRQESIRLYSDFYPPSGADL